MKLLLLGCNGQVGWELQRSLLPLGEVLTCDFDSSVDRRSDFTNPSSVADLVERIRPDVIVNAAAHTLVDKAEAELERARLINAETVGVVAEQAEKHRALLVHYSTDYVFDGSGTSRRDELAPTGPLSVYGITKLEGENLIRASGCRHVILRTSWVYAARGQNFIKTMLRLAAEREVLYIINDQIGAPTGADLLADITAHVIRSLSENLGEEGTFHCVAKGETSWFGFAQLVIEWARANGQGVKVAPEDVRPILTAQYATPASRPLNSRLSTEKLERVFSLSLPQWQIGVERALREICVR